MDTAQSIASAIDKFPSANALVKLSNIRGTLPEEMIEVAKDAQIFPKPDTHEETLRIDGTSQQG